MFVIITTNLNTHRQPNIMQCGNNILPRTWSTEAVAGSDDFPTLLRASRIGRTWSTEAVAGSDDCPPSPTVSPVSDKQVSFDGTIKLHHYMVESHMKPTKEVMAVRKAARAVRIVARATRKARATRATRVIATTRV